MVAGVRDLDGASGSSQFSSVAGGVFLSLGGRAEKRACHAVFVHWSDLVKLHVFAGARFTLQRRREDVREKRDCQP